MTDVGNQNIIGIDGMKIYFAQDLGFKFFNSGFVSGRN
jgi:hypothetical protein